MRKPQRRKLEEVVRERASRLKSRSYEKMQQKLEKKQCTKEKVFAKFYEMSYNELRQQAKKKKIKIWRKTKKELIELLIEQERLH